GMLSIAAQSSTGAAISYQWQKNGTNIPSATDTALSIPSAGPNDVAPYQCVVSTASVTNTSASVQVRLITNTTLPAISSATLFIHLQADAGVVTNASGMTTWFDQSPNNFEFDTTANSLTTFYPIPTNGPTGNKVIHFEGAHNLGNAGIQVFTDTNSA